MAQWITKLVTRMRLRFERLYGSFFFVRIPVNAVKKIFHRKIQRNSYKNSPLSAHSTLKDAGALRWKKFFFTAIHR